LRITWPDNAVGRVRVTTNWESRFAVVTKSVEDFCVTRTVHILAINT
jgi:hypothetical protein